mgnify:CR=1 FL=1
MSFRASCQHIKGRSWTNIQEKWIEAVPTIHPPGAKPDPGISRLQTLIDVKDGLAHGDLVIEVAGLRANALWEAIFLLHKAAHVVRAAQKHAENGFRSWSLFDGYHGAYLAARAVMGLLGVATPNLDGQQVLLDLFPEQPARKQYKGKPLIRYSPHHFRFLKIPQLEQRHLWELFQRVLRQTVADCWNKDSVTALLGLQCEEISRKRNPYLYNSIFWPLDDLHVESHDAFFCRPVRGERNELILSTDHEAFLLELCFVILNLGLDLLSNLSVSAKQLVPEAALLLHTGFANKNRLLQSYFQVAKEE